MNPRKRAIRLAPLGLLAGLFAYTLLTLPPGEPRYPADQ